ncbi:MAG: type I methionyl aminopeptidase [Lachnospiraceae bacterium]|nr:type I methionyl aminopeptidase [Lachnospiraceae bacterium]
MAVAIRSQREIELLREAGKRLADLHDYLGTLIRPGISTLELDHKAYDYIKKLKDCTPSFLNYDGFPNSLCISINEEIVHGIPKKHTFLKEGDIVTIDAGVTYKAYYSDAARTYMVGEVKPEIRDLVQHTEESFFEAIKCAQAGHHLHEICAAVDDYITPFGYGIIRELCGHGVGTDLHEDPQIPNFRQETRGIKLKPGMVLAVEPMIALKNPEVEWQEDGWGVITKDHSPVSHYENTILITPEGEPEILTLNR